ncbi:MAG: mechanosensitive ion channel family protein [Alistipes sp.]|nr:mechanosensitive ion channel family protein [Alistipes sp.]
MLGFFLDNEAPAGLILPDSVQKANAKEFVERVSNLADMDYTQLLNTLVGELVWIGVKIMATMAVWIVGRWIIRRIIRIARAAFERRNVEASLRIFLDNMIRVVLSTLLILTVVQMLGVNMTTIVALFASATLAIGMALSGTFQNFAGGVMILLLKPYRVGDYITAQGQSGTVTQIKLFSTQIRTTDNRTIYIPNSSISTSIIDNYSEAPVRRVDITVGIPYGTDIDVARTEILAICNADERVLAEPAAPVVLVAELADSSVKLFVRVWVNTADYWDVFYSLNERIYTILPQKGIEFPFPQLDVTIKK